MHPLAIEKRSDVYQLTPPGILSGKNVFLAIVGVCFLFVIFLFQILYSFWSPQFPATWWGVVCIIASLPLGVAVAPLALMFILPFIRNDEWAPIGLIFFVQTVGFFLVLVTIFQLLPISSPLNWILRGCTWALFGLFLCACVRSFLADSRTRRSIDRFSVAISDNPVTIGTAFTLSYQLSFKQAISMDRLNIELCHQVYLGEDTYGNASYGDSAILQHRKATFIGDPADPLVKEFQWTIPAHLNTFSQDRKGWRLIVLIQPHKGTSMHASYPLQVISTRSVSDNAL